MKVKIERESLSTESYQRIEFLLGDGEKGSLNRYDVSNLNVIAVLAHTEAAEFNLIALIPSRYEGGWASISLKSSEVQLVDNTIPKSWRACILDSNDVNFPGLLLAHPFFHDPKNYIELHDNFNPTANHSSYT